MARRHWLPRLFRDFLLSRLGDELDHEAILRLHRDAAVLMERSGAEDEAVPHYLMAEEFGRACALRKHVGRRLFTEGRFQLLNSYLDRIPSSYLDKEPWIRVRTGEPRWRRTRRPALPKNLSSRSELRLEASQSSTLPP